MKALATKTTGKKDVYGFLEKAVIDAGVGRLSTQPNFQEKILPQIIKDIAALSGQKPQVRRAKKSIAGFKTREGQTVGLKVTLRRGRMIDFLERLIKIVLPRVKDFSGIKPTSLDSEGIINIGFKDQFAFPEISPDQSPVSFSLGISIVPKFRNQAKALEEFKKTGLPLKGK